MLKRPCYRCGRPTRQNPCANCAGISSKRPARPKRPRQDRGYDAEYERNRKLLVDHVLIYGAFCVRCGQPIESGQRITADHLVPLRAGGGNGLDNLGPAHARCNYSAGGRRR